MDVPPGDFIAMTRAASTKLGSTPTELPKEARITRVSFRFHLVTDPATLLPYSMCTEAKSKGLYGGKEPIEEGETEEWTFSYDAK
jgi:hypothetical protein